MRLLFRRHHWRVRASAQALVEMALILPIFLFMVIGALQAALVAMVWIGLQGVAQDTTRWMAVSSSAALPTAGNCNPGYLLTCSVRGRGGRAEWQLGRRGRHAGS